MAIAMLMRMAIRQRSTNLSPVRRAESGNLVLCGRPRYHIGFVPQRMPNFARTIGAHTSGILQTTAQKALFTRRSSEANLQAKLNQPRVVGARNFPKRCPVREVAGRGNEVRMVEDVEELCAEFE